MTNAHAEAIIPLLCIPRFIGDELHTDPPPVPLEFNNSLVVDPSNKQAVKDLEAALAVSIKKYWDSKPAAWHKKYTVRPRFNTINGATDIRAGINAVKEKMEVDHCGRWIPPARPSTWGQWIVSQVARR